MLFSQYCIMHVFVSQVLYSQCNECEWSFFLFGFLVLLHRFPASLLTQREDQSWMLHRSQALTVSDSWMTLQQVQHCHYVMPYLCHILLFVSCQTYISSVKHKGKSYVEYLSCSFSNKTEMYRTASGLQSVKNTNKWLFPYDLTLTLLLGLRV